MWPDRPVDIADYGVDEPCAPADLLGEENGETSIARGLPRRSDSGGAVDWNHDLRIACRALRSLGEAGLRRCRVDTRGG